MNDKLLNFTSRKPDIYEQSTSKFWDDEHISKGMLEAHLNPEWDAATRNHKFVSKSVDWIKSIAPPSQYHELLDLGCGPGIYAEKLNQSGYQVTGIDYSKRSLEYARESAEKKNLSIYYRYQDYQDISFNEEYDIITLIYCDFSVLSDGIRKKILENIVRALKPNGKFIVDVSTPKLYEGKKESRDWLYSEGGFWNEKPHLCLNSHYIYEDSRTRLNQTIIVTEDSIECYNIWDHTFTSQELKKDLFEAGFYAIDIYGDVAGASYLPKSNLLCAVATKGRGV
ncbi:MAG: class I SAM-dependent methyltransferase [Mobilitalea sp.]